MYKLAVIVFGACALSVYAQPLSPNNTLLCRSCNRALTLSDCNKLRTCDKTLEECFMDELITDQLTIVYEGGCRSRDVCAHGIIGVGRKKRQDMVACSSCCDSIDDCNKRLCNIKDATLNSSQCYSCDHRNSEQGEVTDPKTCVTLDVCQPNEVCYVQQGDIGGHNSYYYGCKNRQQCLYLMNKAYEDYKRCTLNDTSLLEPGMSWQDACIRLKRRSTNLCHHCCAGEGCNYGFCPDLNKRVFLLADKGKFDFATLKTLP